MKRYNRLNKKFMSLPHETPGERLYSEYITVEKAAEGVGIAFGKDTSDRNSMDTCKAYVRPGPFIDRLLEKWRKRVATKERRKSKL